MPFRFKKSESPAKAVRRVCRERVGAALGRLRKPDSPAAVHGVRKEIKKLRALFRLVRAEIGRGVYRKGAKALREAADSLTAPRDARVMLKVFGKLAGRDARKFAGIEKALRKNCRQESRRFRKKDSAAAADRILRKTSRRVGELKIKAVGWAAIEPGLKESYRRGREACRLAGQQPSPENFHDWRKHVKDLWHYFCLLYPAWPRGSARIHGRSGVAGRTAGRGPRSFPVATIRGGALRRAGGGGGGVERADRVAPETIARRRVETGFTPLCRSAGGHLPPAGKALERLAREINRPRPSPRPRNRFEDEDEEDLGK